MSPYGYDYSLTRGSSPGWRSRFATVMTVSAVAAISAISGAAVAVNLLGQAASTTAERPVIVGTHRLPASAPVAQAVTPAAPQPAAVSPNASAVVAQPQPAAVPPNASAAVAQPQASTVAVQPPPAAAPAPQSAPAAVAAVEEPSIAQVSERELTFTQGYARRRAVQAAADAASGKTEGPKAEVARAEPRAQAARPAAKTRVRAVARAAQEQRRVAEGGWFGRFDQRDRFDFGRHQALAFGESRDPRPRRAPAQGGFFGGLF